jgi:hypothetical protein
VDLLALWFVSTIIAAAVLSGCNKAGTGMLLGIFLGPLGVIIAIIVRLDVNSKQRAKDHAATLAALKTTPAETRPERECPFCAERILARAKVCKHCGRDVEPLPEAAPARAENRAPLASRPASGEPPNALLTRQQSLILTVALVAIILVGAIMGYVFK